MTPQATPLLLLPAAKAPDGSLPAGASPQRAEAFSVLLRALAQASEPSGVDDLVLLTPLCVPVPNIGISTVTIPPTQQLTSENKRDHDKEIGAAFAPALASAVPTLMSLTPSLAAMPAFSASLPLRPQGSVAGISAIASLGVGASEHFSPSPRATGPLAMSSATAPLFVPAPFAEEARLARETPLDAFYQQRGAKEASLASAPASLELPLSPTQAAPYLFARPAELVISAPETENSALALQTRPPVAQHSPPHRTALATIDVSNSVAAAPLFVPAPFAEEARLARETPLDAFYQQRGAKEASLASAPASLELPLSPTQAAPYLFARPAELAISAAETENSALALQTRPPVAQHSPPHGTALATIDVSNSVEPEAFLVAPAEREGHAPIPRPSSQFDAHPSQLAPLQRPLAVGDPSTEHPAVKQAPQPPKPSANLSFSNSNVAVAKTAENPHAVHTTMLASAAEKGAAGQLDKPTEASIWPGLELRANAIATEAIAFRPLASAQPEEALSPGDKLTVTANPLLGETLPLERQIQGASSGRPWPFASTPVQSPGSAPSPAPINTRAETERTALVAHAAHIAHLITGGDEIANRPAEKTFRPGIPPLLGQSHKEANGGDLGSLAELPATQKSALRFRDAASSSGMQTFSPTVLALEGRRPLEALTAGAERLIEPPTRLHDLEENKANGLSVTRLRLALRPPLLGEILLEIRHDSQSVSAQAIVSQPTTEAILRRIEGELQQWLHSQGLQLGAFEVMCQQSGDFGGQQAERGPAVSSWSSVPVAVQPSEEQPPPPSLPAAARLVDLYA